MVVIVVASSFIIHISRNIMIDRPSILTFCPAAAAFSRDVSERPYVWSMGSQWLPELGSMNWIAS